MKSQKRQNRGALWRKAIDRADFEKLELLCKKKGETEKLFRDLGTPFDYAVAAGSVETVAFLLKQGAKLEYANCPRSPLMTAVEYAAYRGNRKMVCFLLSAGTKVNWRSRYSDCPGGVGGTALFSAASRGDAKTTRMLLDAGADVNLVNKKGGNALTEAVRYGHTAVMEMLIEAGSRAAGAVICVPCFKGDLPLVRRLITLGADPNAKFDDSSFSRPGTGRIFLKGETPLGSAARFGEAELSGALLKAGALANQVSLLRTPLAWACGVFDYTEAHLAIVKQLLAAGAAVNVTEGVGQTPLHWAAERGYLEVAIELLKAGADPSLKERYEGCTPVDLARKGNHLALATLLEDARDKRRS